MPVKYCALTETTKALNLPKRTLEIIIEKGVIKTNGREKNQRKSQFSKIDDLWKNLIRQVIYHFYRTKYDPTLDILVSKLQEISPGTESEFSYSKSTLHIYIKRLDFSTKKLTIAKS